jgi:NADH-quinone oxidoreductase subunit M
VFAAGYLLWMYQRTAFGNPKPEFEHEHIHDVHVPEYIAWAPMLILIVVLGLVPNLLFRITDGSVHQNVTAAFTQTGLAPAAPGAPAQAEPAKP